jgi:hypothetical protein
MVSIRFGMCQVVTAGSRPIGLVFTIMSEPNPAIPGTPGQSDTSITLAPAREMAAPTRQAPVGPLEPPSSTRSIALATRDAAVRLVADGTGIYPVETCEETYRFVVSRNVRCVSFESRWILQGDDTGCRGISVAEIKICSKAGEVIIAADDPRLTSGWFDAERDGISVWRRAQGTAQLPWTNGPEPAVVTIRCKNLARHDASDIMSCTERIVPGGVAPPRDCDSDDKPGEIPAGVIQIQVSPTQSDAIGMQWCLGMYSSGSTWVFNALLSVADAVFPGESHVGIYAESLDHLPFGWEETDRLIVKSHHPDETAIARLAQRADRLWISIRDPRDCVASAMTYMFPDFHSALDAVTRSAEHCARYILDSRCMLMKYEDGFIDNPTTLNRFAAGCSRSLLPEDRDRLFQQMRRTAIESMIQKFEQNETVDDGFAGHRVHLKTQWHTHHLNRTGEVGRWRHTLSAVEIVEVHRRLGPWMERFGYC